MSIRSSICDSSNCEPEFAKQIHADYKWILEFKYLKRREQCVFIAFNLDHFSLACPSDMGAFVPKKDVALHFFDSQPQLRQ